MKKNHVNQRILFRYLFYFLLVLSIPILSMGISYSRVANILRANASQQNQTALQTSAETIDRVLTDVNNVVYYISTSTDITRFLQLRPLDVDKTIVSDITKAQKSLKSYIIANSFIKEIQVYAFQSGIMVDSVTSVLDLERYYGIGFEMEQMDYARWREEFLEQRHRDQLYPSASVACQNEWQDRLLYAQTIPMSGSDSFGGNVFLFLDEEQLLEQFGALQYGSGGMLCVLNREGNAVLQDNPGGLSLEELETDLLSGESGSFLQDFNGETMLVSYLRSGDSGWTYLAVLPQQVILEPSQGIRVFLVGMIAASLAISVGLALFSAVRTSRPVISISNLLSRSSRALAPEELSGEISRLIENNDSMRAVIRQQMDDQRAALFYSLLSGGFRDEAEIRRSFSKFHITLDAPRYCLLMISLEDWEIDSPLAQLSAYKKLMKEVLTSRISGAIGVCDLDLRRSLLLAAAPAGSVEAYRDSLREEARKISEQFSQAVQSGIYFTACMADNLMQIPSAFLFLQTSEDLPEEEGCVLWSPGTREPGRHFYYPLNLEIRMISAVQEGNSGLVEDTLELIARHNRRLLSDASPRGGDSYAYQLIQALYGTLLRLVNEASRGREELALRSRMIFDGGEEVPPSELFRRMRECYLAAAASYGEKDGAKGEALKRSILEYVNSHFTDAQLSLTSVASEFHITEPYLSRLFKQSAGENFSKYVEKLRMERAHRLIQEGRLSLNDVAEAVGYNSPQVFRRAYRRVYGASPSEGAQKEAGPFQKGP